MHLILTGATGLIGSAVLNYVLQTGLPSGQISHLSILTRRPVALLSYEPPNDKITVIQHADYGSYSPELLQQLHGADGCIWAIGVSQSAVSATDFVNITVDYATAAARAFATLAPRFNFVFVSSDGATQEPGVLTMPFRRVKGQAEAALIALSKEPDHASLRVFSVRPGGVDPRDEPRVLDVFQHHRSRGYSPMLEKVLLPIYGTVYPSGVTPAGKLGKLLVDIVSGDGEPLKGEDVEGDGRFIPNKAILRMINKEAK